MIFMFHAILVIGDGALWGNKLKYGSRVTFHWVLQLIAWTLISLGFAAIYVNKNRLGKQHFHTTHAIFGLVTVIGTQAVILGGVWTKYSFKLRGLVRPVVAKLLHSILGIVVYTLAMITISLGVYTKWWEKVSNEETAWLIIAMLVFSAIFVAWNPLKMCVKRYKTAFMRSNL